MSMCGELSYFLGLQVKQQDHGIFISQTKYANDLVKKFGMSSTKPTRNPMATHNKIDADPSGKCVEQTLYRSMIGSLLYLTASRPISFNVSVCARFQANPKESHLNAVKRIIKYVSGYTDANWAENVDDRKSTSGGCFYMSDTESEYSDSLRAFEGELSSESSVAKLESADYESTDVEIVEDTKVVSLRHPVAEPRRL
ncbi:uncharacterized protein LOC110746767, partial [Prunus avium]|uniref:Uncharacterized protein LOC110746767 n=1 Tax=Prunus avium TaxID=42229 RepID=A0A6P5RCP4_PRUAV